MKEAAVPMPASGGAPAGAGGNGGGHWGGRGRPVPNSRDLQRILSLPRRDPLDLKSERADAMVQLITERYSNGVKAGGFPNKDGIQAPCRCKEIDPRRFKDGAIGCVTEVLPIQAWTMYEMGIVGGAIGSIPAGFGKTLLGILGILPLGVQTALVLIPSNLLKQFWSDYQLLAEHFTVPSVWIEGINKGHEIRGMPKIFVLPYGLLSRPGRSAYIDDLKPEAIISDEADKLADIRGSATARRVLRYYVEYPNTKFAAWTGSLTDKKISEFSHLIVMALKDNAPVPHDPDQVTNWGMAIDVSEEPAEAGALRALMNIEETMLADETKAVRRAFGRRLADTMGIITTSETEVEVSDVNGTIKGSRVEFIVREQPAPAIPPRVQMALTWARGNVRPDKELGFSPGNEELESPMEKARTIAEIASGVMNVWEFPPTTPDRKKFLKGGVPQENKVIDEWYDLRAPWNKAVRGQCLLGVPHMDSPYLCEIAASRHYGDLPAGDCGHRPLCDPKKLVGAAWDLKHPHWDAYEWPAWRDIRKQVKPLAVAKRIDDFIVKDAAKWATENRGIVWYSLVEFGKWVAEQAGLPLQEGGPKAEERLKREMGDRSIIASIDSHGRGRNGLQFLFAAQLVAQIPSSSRRWAQLLARLVRRGQRSQEVITYLYLHVPELKSAIEQALKRSEYVEDTWRMQQMLLGGWKKHMVG